MDEKTIDKINFLMEKYIKHLEGFEYGKDKDGNDMSYRQRFIGKVINNHIHDQIEASQGCELYSSKDLDKDYERLNFVIDYLFSKYP